MEPEASVVTPRKVMAKWWPWLLALTILAFLLAWVPRKALLNALKTGPWLSLGVYTFFQALVVLWADTYATAVSLAITGFRRQFSQILLARGASYILGILNYSLGQGALGIYLQRSGLTTIRAAGNMLFLMLINLVVLLFIATFGFWAGGFPKSSGLKLSPLFWGLWLGIALYLVIIVWRPRLLERYQLLVPLLQAGLRGHLRAAAGRLPHMLFLVLAYWGALRLWGIPVPLPQGMAMISVVLFINAVPITPLGLGTTQVALVLLASPYVPLPNPDGRAAVVLAFSLTYYFFVIVSQALLGLWCFQKIRQVT